jgi:hypothetical protein
VDSAGKLSNGNEQGHDRQPEHIMFLRLARTRSLTSAKAARPTTAFNDIRSLHATPQSQSWKPERPHFYPELNPWLRSQGIVIHPDVAIEFSKEGGSRVVVKSPIEAGKKIITVPESAVFCAANVYKQSPLAAGVVKQALVGYAALSGLERAEREYFGLVELSLLAWLQHESINVIGNEMQSREDRTWMRWLQFWPTQAPTAVLLTPGDIENLIPAGAWDHEKEIHGENAVCFNDFKDVLLRTQKFVDVLSDSLEVDLRPLLDVVDSARAKAEVGLGGASGQNETPFSEQIRDFYSVCSERAMDTCHSSILEQNDIAKKWGLAIVPAVDFVSLASENDSNSELVIASSASTADDVSFCLCASRKLDVGEVVMRDVGARTNESAVLKRGFFDANLRLGHAASSNWGHVSPPSSRSVIVDAPAFKFV